jgi:SSS family solute:Na+ symporter
MVSFSTLDLIILFLFFGTVLLIGLFSRPRRKNNADEYLLYGRKTGLFLFVLVNVSTWYGGILGVGEFTYRYGLASWFTQGFPYYIFAFLFAILLARKIRHAELFTIPDKLSQAYGDTVGLISAVLVFILVSPAPYLLMTANLLSIIFNISIIPALIISLLLGLVYLFRGGFKADLFTNAFQFFIMFAGFIIALIISWVNVGDIHFLQTHLPPEHLQLTGGASPLYILVWFLIAMWTFADPGFHQRCYAAKSGSVAVKGILISIIFFALFDFLTTSVGLYARAVVPGLAIPVLSFPLYAEKILPSGVKGLFYAALFATIISTLNAFLFLSATTVGRDFIFRFSRKKDETRLRFYTNIGLIAAGAFAVLTAYLIPSVIDIWYTIGSVCIPAIILPVLSAYYPKIKVERRIIIAEMLAALIISSTWYFLRKDFSGIVREIEPMIIGLLCAFLIHFSAFTWNLFSSSTKKAQLNR